MKKILNIFLAFAALAIISTSCVKDLDTIPIDPDVVTAAQVFDDPDSYKQILAKLYAGYSVSGQQGPAGQPDISGIDEGFGQYLRGYWYTQELTTDEAVIGWNDQTIKNFHGQSWGASDVFIAAFYYRIFYQIAACNEYLRETTDEKLSERGVSGQLLEDVKYYRAEARFLRAVSYWHAMDLFANVPFVTEYDPVGAFFPLQIMRADLFDYIESELLEIESLLKDPKTNEYARVDKAAAWMLLAKIYLNAEVYTGTAKWDGAVTYSEKVITSGYTLDPTYENMFLADNNNSPEIIWPVTFDGLSTQTWGGMTFIIHAAIGGDAMVPADYGMDGGWGGTRTTSAFVRKFFPDIEEEVKAPSAKEWSVDDYPVLYVPGSYQGWDPANTLTVLGSVNSDGNYEGYLNFPDESTQFKFTPQPDWSYDWGDEGADGTLDVGGANIEVAEAGYYKINVDTNALTYTVLKTTWGVIGDFTEWAEDVNLEYNAETGLWEGRVDITVAGGIKFRANDDWAINYGTTDEPGVLVLDGGNITIEAAGTYNITLKLGAPDYTYTIERTSYDQRAMFFTEGQTLEIQDISNFNDGYAITKFKNVTSTGATGSDLTFPDTDFPMFRAADAYLIYAEAVLRGGGGSTATALDYVNQVRTRAFGGSTDGNITSSELNLDFILDERARELYWECTRRTDLVRYDKFTSGSYLWPWKGNAAEGTATNEKFNIFPIPDSDVNANSNLQQNPGY